MSRIPSSSRSRQLGPNPSGWYRQLPMNTIQTVVATPSSSTGTGSAWRRTWTRATIIAGHFPIRSSSFSRASTRSV